MSPPKWLLALLIAASCRSSRMAPDDETINPNARLPPVAPARPDASPPGDARPAPQAGGDDFYPPSPDGAARTDTSPVPDPDIVRPSDASAVDIQVDQRPATDQQPVVDGAVETPAANACVGVRQMGEVGVFDVGVGNCSFPVASLPTHAVSVDSPLYAAGAACGTCLEVGSGDKRVVALVVDHYPVQPGPRGHRLSLSRAAFTKVTGSNTGLLQLPWRRVPCPVTGSITAALKDGSSAFYWEVIFQNVTNPIAAVEFAAADGRWVAVKRESYNYFRQASASGLPPRFRLTDVHGNVATTGALVWPKTPVTTPIPIGVQFPAPCAP